MQVWQGYMKAFQTKLSSRPAAVDLWIWETVAHTFSLKI